MPPEPLPWDRKELLKERKQERSSESVSRWREAPPHHGSSSLSRDSARWGSAEFRSRPPGHGKQSGWNWYSEGSGHGLMPFRSSDKILDDESYRQSGSRGDGKYIRNSSRDSKGSFSQKDWKGQSWESCASPNGAGRPPMSDKRSVDDTVTHNAHSHSDFVNSWDQVPFKDQHDKTGGVNGLGTGQKSERETLGSIDWKPLKWTRSGSLSSRSSGFSHSSSSKNMGTDLSEAKVELQLGKASPIQSPSGDAVLCATSVALSEETSSRKKPRLKWGEGLAKYEKKKVEGPEDSATKLAVVVCGTAEPLESQLSNLADKSPRVAAFSDSASPATPSSVACSSSPGVEDKPSLRAVNIDTATSNLSGSPAHPSRHHPEGRAFNVENLELTSVANLSYSLSELLQSDDPGSVDSSYVISTGMNKLLLWKSDILKALEMTETEIDSLENELKSFISASGNGCPCPSISSPSQGESQVKPCEELVVASNVISQPASLPLVSSRDMTEEKAVGGLEEKLDQVIDENIDSPGTVTSKFVEQIPSAKGVAVSDPLKINNCYGDLSERKSGNLEVKFAVSGWTRNGAKKEDLTLSEVGDSMMGSKACGTSGRSLQSDREDVLYELIVASNRDSANRASEVFNKLLPPDQSYVKISGTSYSTSCSSQPSIKDKFAMRKHVLRFKERVITLKFRALQHLWMEDLRLLSMKKHRAKSQKRTELSSRVQHGSYQKHRTSIRSRFYSPAGNSSLVPTMEIINVAGKFLSDTQVKPYRNSLKMPAMILDKKEKIISRFISNNGLVEDPCAVEKERALLNPWTTEERETFMAKFTTFGKNFQKIASFLDHKTTADCIEFYYKNHKSDCFVKGKKNPEYAKQGKSSFLNNYLVTSGKRWNRETNAASLDILGAASAIVAKDNDVLENQQKCKARFLYKARYDDGIRERSGNLNAFDNERERESVAADVLAGICGSLSSEAMSSCITSSFDLGESHQDLKRQKVGFTMRRPLTPEVTQNVDDETCSDESCGEMDPTDWTDEEKSTFIQAVTLHGKDFTKISRCVRTRSTNQCKVFFSKARKCLGLDSIHPRAGDDGGQIGENANGGGTDNEDACVVETGSAVCSDKSGSKMDDNVSLSDSKMNNCEPDFTEAMNLQTGLNRVEDNEEKKIDLADTKLQSENLVSDELQAEVKAEIDFDGVDKMENDIRSLPMVIHQDHKAVVFPRDVAGAGATALGDLWSAKDTVNDHCPSVSGETMAVGEDPDDSVVAKPKGEEPELEHNLNQKHNENEDANVQGTGDLNCSDHKDGKEFDICPKQEQKTFLELNSQQEPFLTSLLPNQNLLVNDPDARNCETRPNLDSTLALDLGKVGEKPLQTAAGVNDYNQHQSGLTVLGNVEPCQILKGYPVPVSTKELMMNGEINSKKLDSLENPKRTDRNTHSETCLSADSFLKKCCSSKAESSVSEFPFLCQEQKSHCSRPHSLSSSEMERPSRNGDVKLFGQILTHPSSQKKQNGTQDNENNGAQVQHPKLSGKSLNLKFSSPQNIGVNTIPAKLDENNYVGLENVPIRSYGFWDGNRIQTGLTTLPDSAILLAKYPAAFGNYSTSSTEPDLKPLHSVEKNSENSLNGLPVFSAREMNSSNGVEDHRMHRNQEDIRLQPFTVNVNGFNGFDALSNVSNVQQQALGPSGINVVGRGGILCTGVPDTVATIKMRYAKTEQYSGQQGSINREESWRGKGDVGM